MECNIGFLTLEQTSTDGFIGAILVTDSTGVPQEFRCTHSVKPTGIQRQLYGGMLQPHIGVELCGRPLLREIKTKPAIILVKETFMLAIRGNLDKPVVWIGQASGVIERGDATTNSEKLESQGGEYEPMVVKPQIGNNPDLPIAMEILRSLSFDPLEPFARVQTALKSLAEADAKYR